MNNCTVDRNNVISDSCAAMSSCNCCSVSLSARNLAFYSFAVRFFAYCFFYYFYFTAKMKPQRIQA